MIKIIKIFICLIILFMLAIPIILISIGIKISSNGPIIHWSKRIGKNNVIFLMPKFKTMKEDTPQLASSIIKDKSFITPYGKILRKLSVDEIPQLYSIIKGDMNFIGPRPALFNQYDLIKLRNKNDLNKILPGITGWAQVNGRDEISIEKKIDYECEYMLKKTITFDFYILALTFIRVFLSKDISH